MYLDFADIKARNRIEDVASLLQLELKPSGEQLRGACPVCDGSDRSLVVTPGKQAFYCHEAKKGGDLISLVAHINGVGMKDAALYLTEDESDRSPEKAETRTFQPLTYLEYEHEAVQALGIEAETAEALGIGYAKKGMMRGKIAVPVRMADGTLTGYIGITEAKLPPRWQI